MSIAGFVGGKIAAPTVVTPVVQDVPAKDVKTTLTTNTCDSDFPIEE